MDTDLKDEVLHTTEWVELRRRAGWYDYLHESRCNGQIVAILIWRHTAKRFQVLGRYEHNPAWAEEGMVLTSITGGLDNQCKIDGETQWCRHTAVHEVLEEGGFEIDEADLVPLGQTMIAKSADTRLMMYALDVEGREQKPAQGDGTRGEEGAFWQWKTLDEMLSFCVDPIFFAMLARAEMLKVFPYGRDRF